MAAERQTTSCEQRTTLFIMRPMRAAAEAKPTHHLEELCRGPHCVTCAYGNVVLSLSIATPTEDYLQRNVRAVLAHGAKHPSGLGLLGLISSSEPAPDQPTRHMIQASYVSIAPAVRCIVLVVEGEGVVAVAKRSAIAVMSSSGAPFPIRVASTMTEGSHKMVSMLGAALAPGLDSDRLAVAAAEVRTCYLQR